MEVKIKVRLNGDEIAEAKRKNEFYAKKRDEFQNASKTKQKQIGVIPDDVPIPDDDVKIVSRFIRKSDIREFYENDVLEDMVVICRYGLPDMMVIKTDELLTELKKEFEPKDNE